MLLSKRKTVGIRVPIYAVHVEGMRRLLTFLTEDCCQGQPELCGAAFAEMSKLCVAKAKCK